MMHQVHLEMTGLLKIPGQAQRRNVLQQAQCLLGFTPRQPPFVLPQPGQDALDGRDADLAQLRQHSFRHRQFPVLDQQLRCRYQSRRQTLGADVIQALGHHPDHVVHPCV